MLHCTMATEILCVVRAHDSWHEDCAACGDSIRYTLPGNVRGIVGCEARGQTAHDVMRHTRPLAAPRRVTESNELPFIPSCGSTRNERRFTPSRRATPRAPSRRL